MSSNAPQGEQEKQPQPGLWAKCLDRMTAICGGATRQSAACCDGASDEPAQGSAPQSGPACHCGTTQPDPAPSGPEMI
jgi:hypothetical protein